MNKVRGLIVSVFSMMMLASFISWPPFGIDGDDSIARTVTYDINS